jgi:hypothetical protein
VKLFYLDGRARPCQHPDYAQGWLAKAKQLLPRFVSAAIARVLSRKVQRTWTAKSVLLLIDTLPASEERDSLAMAAAHAWIKALQNNRIEALSSIMPGFRLLDEGELLLLAKAQKSAELAEGVCCTKYILVRSDDKLPVYLRAWMQLKISGYSDRRPKSSFWEFSVSTHEALFP